MPISREEFSHGRIDLALPLLRVLQDRAALAFTAEEVRTLLARHLGRDAEPGGVVEALESLAARGEVQARDIGGVRWYTANVAERRLGFGRG